MARQRELWNMRYEVYADRELVGTFATLAAARECAIKHAKMFHVYEVRIVKIKSGAF
jgi:hypothetical protein